MGFQIPYSMRSDIRSYESTFPTTNTLPRLTVYFPMDFSGEIPVVEKKHHGDFPIFHHGFPSPHGKISTKCLPSRVVVVLRSGSCGTLLGPGSEDPVGAAQHGPIQW